MRQILLARGTARFDVLLTLLLAGACDQPANSAPIMQAPGAASAGSAAGTAPDMQPGASAGTGSQGMGSQAAGPQGMPAGMSSADGGVSAASASDIKTSHRANLQWKRYAAFEADLSAGLSLPKETLCTELGRENCVRGVHLTPLGGHDPFATGLLEPSAEPLATTPTVVERVVLSACSARLELDKAGKRSDAKVFAAIDLSQPAPAPSEPASRELVSALYRKLLARDPDEAELGIVSGLARDLDGKPVPAADFALSACVAIGTSTEFLFF
jgi:hypothetical protein